jgi:D-arabinose 1-dehydrogenase-like Zn-dependent alcohol dehydrogenase
MTQTFETPIQAARVSEAGGDLAVVTLEKPEPGPGQVGIAVEACGICHSDIPVVNGYMPGSSFPLVPGHEIAGRIEAVGTGVSGLTVGQRVAVGYWAGSCGRCEACQAGDTINCPYGQIPGVSYQGGYSDTLVVPADGVSVIPDGMTSSDAAVLSCAGLTAFNALRNSDARPGDLVAVQGLGGVGHIAVQMAARMGFETAAVSRGPGKLEAAKDWGAHHVVDSTARDMETELQELGGAKLIISTVDNSTAMSSALGGLGRRGELITVGMPPEDLSFNALRLISGMHRISGIISGTPRDREEAFHFAELAGIRPLVEEFPLEKAPEAYERMRSGQARFRVVLTTGR